MKKKLFICIFLPLLFGITAGKQNTSVQHKNDTIPKTVQVEAMKKTDKQVDSIYSTLSAQYKGITNHFMDMRDHMDTMNMQYILMAKAAEKSAIERDKAVHQRLLVIESYAKLKNEKQESDRIARFAANWPTWCMVLLLTIAGSYFGAGVANGLHKSKKDE